MAQPALNLVPPPACPEAAARYLAHALGPETPPVHAVVLRMHGEIALGGRWLPFEAREWLAPRTGFDWHATVRAGLVRISGYDRLLQGHGEMDWRLYGLIPIARAHGHDVTQSSIGRLAAETVWTPSFLASSEVAWSENPDYTVRAHWHFGETGVAVDLEVDDSGRLLSLSTLRWGNPDQTHWRPVPFGGYVTAERTFGGFTVPSRLSIGWWPDDDHFAEGEFLRVELDEFIPLL